MTTASSGWQGLLAIIKESIEAHQQQAAMPPVACPHDGEPLRPAGSRGGLHCPYCGYRA